MTLSRFVCEDHPDQQFDACPCGAPGMPRPDVTCRGLVVHIDEEPSPRLASPIMTRPQDWAPAARRILWGRS